MKFSPSQSKLIHINKNPFNETYFYAARLIYFADTDNKRAYGSASNKAQNLSPEEELKRRQQELENQTPESMLAKIDNLPSSVQEKAKQLWKSGNIMQKTLVIQLTEHLITPDQFRKLLKCLSGNDENSDERKQLFITLAEQAIFGNIASDAFEKALIGMEANNQECERLVADLKNGKIKGEKFTKEIKKLKIKTRENELPSYTPEQVSRLLHAKMNIMMTRIEDIENKKVGNLKDPEKLRKFAEDYKNAGENIINAHDDLENLFAEMAGTDENQLEVLRGLLWDEKYMGTHALREPVRINEQDIDPEALRSALEKIGGKEFAEKFNNKFVQAVHALQEARREMASVEYNLKELFEPINNAISEKYDLKKEIESAERWLGIKLREGVKIKCLQIIYNPQTQRQEYVWGESEIMRIGFVDDKYIEEGGEYKPGRGTMLIIVTGAGEFTLATMRKWMDMARASQKIETIEEAEKAAGLSEYGIKLAPGMNLEYDRNIGLDDRGEIITKTEKVKIEKIENGKIILDRPVTVLYKEEMGNRPIADSESGGWKIFENDITQQEFEFGEFVKWFLRKGVRPSLTINEANAALRAWGRNFGGEPPQIAVGNTTFRETPRSAGTEAVSIEGIQKFPDGSDAVVVKKTGGDNQTLTPAQFLETARKRELTDADPKKYADRAVEHIEDNQEKEKERSKAENEQKERIASAMKKKKGEGETEVIQPHVSTIKRLWDNTTFLSLQDVTFIFKTIYEYHVRRWQRRMKNNTGSVGEHFPIVGTDFVRMKEAAEHEEVENYKKGFEHVGIREMRERMYHARNKDELRAAIETLVEKGQMRWDDVRLWEAINRFTDPDKQIPIPLNMDPAAKVKQDPVTGAWKTGQDLLEPAIDAMWGEGIFGSYYNKNHHTYISKMNEYKAKGDQLENDPKGIGGLRGEMRKLLTIHKNGGWVNPQQYEGLYRFSIEKGKMTVEDKVYYLIQGVATGLLSLDRVGAINGDLLNHMPWLDYFTNKGSWKFGQADMPPDKKLGDSGGRPYTVDDYKRIAAFLDQDGIASKEYINAPGPRTAKFLWEIILGSRDSRVRIQKALQQSDRLDHDDTHFILPLLDSKKITQLTKTVGLQRDRFSNPAYLNVYPGFNQYIKTLGILEPDPEAVVKALASFVTYDAILDERYLKKHGSDYIRITRSEFKEGAVVDPVKPVAYHRDVLQNLVLEIGRAYGQDFKMIFEKTGPLGVNPANDQRQNKIEAQIASFEDTLTKIIATDDNGVKMFEVIRNANLRGC